MRLITKLAAGVLLGIGVPIVLGMAVYVVRPQSTADERAGAIASAVLLGLPPTALGLWLIRNGRRQHHERDRLQATFFKLLQQNNGRITPLGFAMATNLSGELAKAYLDGRAREFSANFEVDEQGYTFYVFNVGGALPETPKPRTQPAIQPVVIRPSASPPGSYDVILEAVPDRRKIDGIKAVRQLTGLGLKESKELVEAAPTVLQAGVSKDEADICLQVLEAIGAHVMIIEN